MFLVNTPLNAFPTLTLKALITGRLEKVDAYRAELKQRRMMLMQEVKLIQAEEMAVQKVVTSNLKKRLSR